MSRSLDGSGRPVGGVREVKHFHSPRQTLMRSIDNRGVDALWAAGGRLFFMLDNPTSEIWSINELAGLR